MQLRATRMQQLQRAEVETKEVSHSHIYVIYIMYVCMYTYIHTLLRERAEVHTYITAGACRGGDEGAERHHQQQLSSKLAGTRISHFRY